MKLKLPKIPKVEMFGIDVIKNMLFFTLFVVVFLFLLGIIVAPSIKKFKEYKHNYFTTKMKYDDTTKTLEKTSYEYQKLFKENKRLIFALKREFNKDNFKMFSNRYMKVLDIKDTNISVYKKDFIKKTYIVTAKLKSPVDFYKFVDASKNYKNIIKIYFPIVFKAKNGDINLIYRLEHFKVK
jgi:hypothetical protein